MIRKLYKLTAAAALAVMCAAPWGAGGAARAQQISVGDTVHVSGARPTTDHHEVVVAADPARPERMIAASMAFSAEQKKGYTVVYASRDGGRSWAQTLETLSTSDLGADPWCAYGPDGTAYYSVCLCATAEAPCLLYVYSSKDGGTTWGKPAIAPASEYSARPYIAVDDTGGRYAGRAYVFLQIFRNEALGGVRRATDVALYRSRDGGAGFDPPVRLSGLDTRSIVWPGNAAVLPDGTVVAPVVEARRRPPEGDRPGPIWVDNKEPNAKLLLVKSEDGGDSLVNASTVSDAYIFYPVSTVSVMPSLAVDRLSEAFKGRVYVAWADTRSGRTEILFAHSPDGGKTWAKPITVNDDRPFAPPARGPDHFMPTLAVNREGVVGVMWYDRRDNTDNFGWHTRFAASLDGGETFLPSVRVSGGGQSVTKGEWMLFGLATQPEAASAGGLMLKFYADGSQFNGGHTAGMTTGRNGSFHPVWVDNRTGKRQVWTARIEVRGGVSRNGSPGLAGLDDISNHATLVLGGSSYDPATGIATTDVQVKNTSSRVISGPVRVWAWSLRSDIADEVRHASPDGAAAESVAVWDFTPLLENNQLKPGETSRKKKLFFRLTGFHTPARTFEGSPFALTAEARILGKLSPAQTRHANPERPIR